MEWVVAILQLIKLKHVVIFIYRAHVCCVSDDCGAHGMERNIGDQLNKAFEAYRQVSIEKDNAKKELQKMVKTWGKKQNIFKLLVSGLHCQFHRKFPNLFTESVFADFFACQLWNSNTWLLLPIYEHITHVCRPRLDHIVDIDGKR